MSITAYAPLTALAAGIGYIVITVIAPAVTDTAGGMFSDAGGFTAKHISNEFYEAGQ